MDRSLFARPRVLLGAAVAAGLLVSGLWVARTDGDPSRSSVATRSGRDPGKLRPAVVPPPSRRVMTQEELGRRIAAFSRRYLGTAYRRDPLGEGPSASVDRDPLICRTGVDCQTFVEQVVAEALARRPEDILPLLTRIRYRDGEIGFGTRNHYMVSDWLPHNRWCIRDLTAEVGGGRAQTMEKIIDRAAFFRSHGVPALGSRIAPELSRTMYLPRALMPEVLERVPNGAILIWVQDRPGIIAAHCGFAVRGSKGTMDFRHASERFGRVMDEPLLAYARRASDRIIGVKVCQAFTRLDTTAHAR
jgi:hypothetical protein